MKNIEWLKEELDDYEAGIRKERKKLDNITDHFLDIEAMKTRLDGGLAALKRVREIIDQLDEPEVLSQEWIDNHTAGSDTIAYYSEEDVPVVTVSDLEKLLVPKLDLPVIPDYVAEWIETIRELNGDMVGALIDGNYNMEVGDWLFLDDDTVNVVNSEKLMSAWRNGYTVEEKKYYILLPKINRNWLYVSLRSNYDEFIDHYTDSVEDLQAFTEKEIKAIEPRYFAFAVKVEELGE